MKNVILTHKELQVNMFLCFSRAIPKLGKDLYLIPFVQDNIFVWNVYNAPLVKEGEEYSSAMISHHIRRDENSINDLRLDVWINFYIDELSKLKGKLLKIKNVDLYDKF